MKKGRLISKIFGIALVFAMISPCLVMEALTVSGEVDELRILGKLNH